MRLGAITDLNELAVCRSERSVVGLRASGQRIRRLCCYLSPKQVQRTEPKPSDTQTGEQPGAGQRRKKSTKVLQHHVAAVSKGSEAKQGGGEQGLISETQSNAGSRMIFAFL